MSATAIYGARAGVVHRELRACCSPERSPLSPLTDIYALLSFRNVLYYLPPCFLSEFEIKIICLRYSAINRAAWIHDLFHLPCHIAKTLSRNEKKIKKKKRKGKLKNEVDEVLTRKVKFNPHSGAKRFESKGKSPLVLILANYFSVVKHSRGGN